MFFEIFIDGGAVIDDDLLLRLGEADFALIAQFLQRRLGLDVEKMHGFRVRNPLSSGSSTAIIADALGREIKKYEFIGQQLRINRENISAGNYFVKVIDANGNVEIRKLLVQ